MVVVPSQQLVMAMNNRLRVMGSLAFCSEMAALHVFAGTAVITAKHKNVTRGCAEPEPVGQVPGLLQRPTLNNIETSSYALGAFEDAYTGIDTPSHQTANKTDYAQSSLNMHNSVAHCIL